MLERPYMLFKLKLTLVRLMLNIRRLPFSVGLKLMRLKRCLRCYMFVRKQANIVFTNIVKLFLKKYLYFYTFSFSRNIYEPFIILSYTNLKKYLIKNKMLETREGSRASKGCRRLINLTELYFWY